MRMRCGMDVMSGQFVHCNLQLFDEWGLQIIKTALPHCHCVNCKLTKRFLNFTHHPPPESKQSQTNYLNPNDWIDYPFTSQNEMIEIYVDLIISTPNTSFHYYECISGHFSQNRNIWNANNDLSIIIRV
eukprot:811661_1